LNRPALLRHAVGGVDAQAEKVITSVDRIRLLRPLRPASSPLRTGSRRRFVPALGGFVPARGRFVTFWVLWLLGGRGVCRTACV